MLLTLFGVMTPRMMDIHELNRCFLKKHSRLRRKPVEDKELIDVERWNFSIL